MESGNGILIAMALGIIGSSVIHLSQGMMRYRWYLRKVQPDRSRMAANYFRVGLLMNFSAPLWVIAANGFAPTVFFTSMYAVGLIPLLIFTCAKMGECFGRRQLAGVATIILGTAVIAYRESRGQPVTMDAVALTPLLLMASIWLLAAASIPMLLRLRFRSFQIRTDF